MTRYDFTPEKFPITLIYMRSDNREVVHTQVIEGPGVICIEPWARMVGCPVIVRVEYGDGTAEQEVGWES